MQLTIDASGRRRCKVNVTERKKLVAAAGVISAYEHCTDSLLAKELKEGIQRLLSEMDSMEKSNDSKMGDEGSDGASDADGSRHDTGRTRSRIKPAPEMGA